MKNVKREQKYIGFILGMIVMLLLSMAVVCVTAEPDTQASPEPVVPSETEAAPTPTAEVPTETVMVPTQQTPVPTTAAPTTAAPTVTATPTPTVQKTTPPTATATRTPRKSFGKPIQTTPSMSPTAGGTSVPTTVVPITPTGSAQMPTTSGATLTPTTSPMVSATVSPTASPTGTATPLFTLGPVNTEDLLPEYTPQVTAGKKAETEVPAETVDMHGYVLRIAATWDEYQDAYLNTEAIAAFEAKYNCKVLFLDLSKEVFYNRLAMSASTGINYFDAILVEGTEILVNMEPLGLLQSFSQYMTEAELSALPVSYQKFLSKDGILYGIPAKAPDISGIWYNPAMIKKYQFTSPLDAYQNSNWSWDQMAAFMQESTQDLDDNGFYDTYGIATSSPWYLPALESTGGSLFRWNGKQFLPSANNAVSAQGLQFIGKIYASHYVASDYERYFYTGQVPYLAGELSMYPELTSYMEDELYFLPYPSRTGAGPYLATATSVPCAAITSTAVYPEQTAELLKILYAGNALYQRIEANCVENGFSDQIKTTYLNALQNFTVDYTGAFDNTGKLELEVLSALKSTNGNIEALQKVIQPLLEQAVKQKSQRINLKEIPVEIRW